MLSALVLFFVCLSFPLHAEPMRVTIVLSDDGGAYQMFAQAMQSKLPASRFSLMIQSAGEPLRGADFYIVVGMKAASALAVVAKPKLSIYVPRTGYDSLIRGASAQHAATHSAIYLDQPMERQIALLRAVLPDARHVGVLYSSSLPELQNIRRLLGEGKMRLHDMVVNEQNPLSDALEKVLNLSEVLFVLPEPAIYNQNTIRNILLAAYRRKIPLIGISQAYVKAGALCAVFSTPEQLATQAAGMIGQYAESGVLPTAQYPSEFEVSVNVQVARSLDLLIKDAEQLRNEIRGGP